MVIYIFGNLYFGKSVREMRIATPTPLKTCRHFTNSAVGGVLRQLPIFTIWSRSKRGRGKAIRKITISGLERCRNFSSKTFLVEKTFDESKFSTKITTILFFWTFDEKTFGRREFSMKNFVAVFADHIMGLKRISC